VRDYLIIAVKQYLRQTENLMRQLDGINIIEYAGSENRFHSQKIQALD
jgi:hypothetical protein